MKSLRSIALALAVVSGLGCKAKSTFVHVTLNPAQPEPSGIKAIELDLMLGSQTATTTLREASGADIALPADATLQIGSGAGQLTITAIARAGDGRELDRGVTTATVVAGAVTEVLVAMAGGKADLEPSEDHHDFGSVAQGQTSATVNLSYINAGYKPTGALSAVLAGAGASAFSLGADTCTGQILAPSSSCSVAVTFHPVTIGALAATVALSGAPGGTATVAVVGAGTPGTQSLSIAVSGDGAGTVTSNPAGFTCTAGPCTAAFPYGSTVTVTAAASTGSSFVRWTGLTGCSTSPTCTVTLPQAGAAGAVFSLNSETLTVGYAGSGAGSVSSPDGALSCTSSGCTGKYLFGTRVTLRATPSTGSVIAGWTGCTPSSDSSSCVATVGIGTAVTVTFGTAMETVSVGFGGNGTGSVSSDDKNISCNSDGTGVCSFQYPYGATLTLQALPQSGSRFGGFSGAGCTGTGPCKLSVNGPMQVTASFVATTSLILSFNGGGSGSVLAAPGGTCNSSPTTSCNITLDSGTAVSLKATAASGSAFGGFAGCSVSASDPTSCSLTLTGAAQTVTTTFNPAPQPLSVTIAAQAASPNSGTAVTGSVSSAPAGINCSSNTCSSNFPYNSQVTLTAAPGASSVFTGWSGTGCSGTGSTCTVTMSQAQAVTANFAASQYYLTVGVSGTGGNGKVTSTPAGVSSSAGQSIVPFAYGTSVTLNALASSSSVYFFGYTGDCSGTTCTVTLDKDRSVAASFHPNFCSSAAPVQEITSTMQGCPGKVTFANRASLCASNCRVATANEWVTLHGSAVPQHHYWTDDALAYSAGQGACGGNGCTTQQCFVTLDFSATVTTSAGGTTSLASNACSTQPMRVCAGSAADSDGNTCTWAGCGYNSVSPNQYFGGCSATSDANSGALCICNQSLLYVDAAAGLDTNAGTSAAPFKTITKAMGAAASGQTVQVREGTYSATNGETFPIKVPAGVSLIGDEIARGSRTNGQSTVITGAGNSVVGGVAAVEPGAGATVAGFTITGVGAGASAVAVAADNVVLRNNTISGSSGYGVYVGARNTAILLNALTGNADGLYFGGGSSGAKIENSSFTGNNDSGIYYASMGGDAGGGSAGSVGNNTLSCNRNADVTSVIGNVSIPLGRNIWDHAPPAQSVVGGPCVNGQDLCLFGSATPVTTGALQSSSTPSCPAPFTP